MTEHSVENKSSLALRIAPSPLSAASELRIFGDWQKAVNHLCDHVLTAPECMAWAIVLPEYDQVVDPTDANSRWRYAARAEASQGVDAQPLYEMYGDAIFDALADAKKLGWWKSSGNVTVALGVYGILVLVERAGPSRDIIVTAFLPGQGTPEAVLESQSSGCERSILSREARDESRGPRRHFVCSAREQRAQKRRRDNLTQEQRQYFDVFKPAVQFIRTRYHAQHGMDGRRSRCDYALLKDVLPLRSQLKIDDWQKCREQCGR